MCSQPRLVCTLISTAQGWLNIEARGPISWVGGLERKISQVKQLLFDEKLEQ